MIVHKDYLMNTLEKYKITEDDILIMADLFETNQGYIELLLLANETKRDSEGTNLTGSEVIDIWSGYYEKLPVRNDSYEKLKESYNSMTEVQQKFEDSIIESEAATYFKEIMIPKTAEKFGVTAELVLDCKCISNCGDSFYILMNWLDEHNPKLKPSLIEVIELYMFMYTHTIKQPHLLPKGLEKYAKSSQKR